MKKASSFITFALAFLFVAEIFLYLDLDAKPTVIIPTGAAFGLLCVVLTKPLIHQYKMTFDDQYRRQYRGLKKHRHSSKHKHHSTRNPIF